MQCTQCYGLKWHYDKEYDGTSLEWRGPICPHCGGTGLEPTDEICIEVEEKVFLYRNELFFCLLILFLFYAINVTLRHFDLVFSYS